MTSGTRRLRTLINLAVLAGTHESVSVETVRELFGISKRRLSSVLDAVRMCGKPPYLPDDYLNVILEGDSLVTVQQGLFRQPLQLTPQEALAVKLVVDEFLRRSPGVFDQPARSLSAKLGKLLRTGSAERADVDASRKKASIIERGLQENRAVRISYYSRLRDEVEERVIEPHAIMNFAGRWYVAAHCRMRGSRRYFRFDRITSAEVLDDEFTPPTAKEIEQIGEPTEWISGESAPEVELEFGPESARWAREEFSRFHVGDTDEGGARFRLPVADHTWLADILVNYEADAAVEGASEARRRFVERIDRIRALYDQ